MRDLRGYAVVLFGLAPVACSESNPSVPAENPAPTPMMENSDPNPAAKFEFAVDGHDERVQGQARFVVFEGDPTITLNIVGGYEPDNLVQIDVAFDGPDGIRGMHELSFGPTDAALARAVASLDGRTYYSEAGELELSIADDGALQGSFEISLAEVGGASPGAEAAPAASATIANFSGHFSGPFNVSCMSPVRGFTGGHSVADSPYCNALEL